MIERTKCSEIIFKTSKGGFSVYGKSIYSQCQRRTYRLSNPIAAEKHANNLSKYYNVPITKVTEN